jgi:hypothetical protein
LIGACNIILGWLPMTGRSLHIPIGGLASGELPSFSSVHDGCRRRHDNYCSEN